MDENKYNVKVIEKFIKVLDIYSYNENAFTLEEITRRTGLPKTTIFRILKTLERSGFFKTDPVQEKYLLGLRFLELGGIVYESLSLRKISSPYLDVLSQRFRAIVLLGIMKDDHLMYVDKRESESIIRVSSYMGLKRPPYYGMLGMTLLAYMKESEAERLLKLYPPTKITEKSRTDVNELMRKLEETRKLGYYIEKGEVIEGLIGVGVPIRDFSGEVVAALGITQPEFQVKEGDVENIIEEALLAAQSISRELGSG
jgi:DNA-binding IclR family transcriptional regulator